MQEVFKALRSTMNSTRRFTASLKYQVHSTAKLSYEHLAVYYNSECYAAES